MSVEKNESSDAVDISEKDRISAKENKSDKNEISPEGNEVQDTIDKPEQIKVENEETTSTSKDTTETEDTSDNSGSIDDDKASESNLQNEPEKETDEQPLDAEEISETIDSSVTDNILVDNPQHSPEEIETLDTVITPEIILENTKEEIEEVKSMFDTLNLTLDIKRLVLISDMHCNYEAFDAVWKDIQKHEFDAIISLGDMVGYATQPNEVIELTRRISSITVQGNHDLALVSGTTNFLYTTLNSDAQKALDHNMETITEDNKKWLGSLPLKVHLTTPYATLTLVHGDPLTIFGYIYGHTPELFEASIKHALDQVETDYLLVGHSHIQGEYIDTEKNKIFVNPGSIGQPRDRDYRAGYAIIDLEKRENKLIRVDYDVSKTIDNIHICNFPEYLGSRLLTGE